MRSRIIHEPVLANTLDMIGLYQQQLKLAKEMVRAVEYRIAMAEELVRANWTGDEHAFKQLAPAFAKNVGSSRRYYDQGVSDGMRTKQAVQFAQQWRTTYEPKEPAAEVPALREGSDHDQAREVPAAPRGAGQVVPDVESEGGALD